MSEHTQLPWSWDETITPFYNDAEGHSRGGDGTGYAEIYRVDAAGQTIFDPETDEVSFVPTLTIANAAFIVTACNSHDELIAALKKAEQLASIAADWNLDEVEIDGVMVKTFELRKEFAAALTRATT